MPAAKCESYIKFDARLLHEWLVQESHRSCPTWLFTSSATFVALQLRPSRTQSVTDDLRRARQIRDQAVAVY